MDTCEHYFFIQGMYNVEKLAVAKNLNKKKRRAEEITQW